MSGEIVVEDDVENSMEPVVSRPEGFHLRPLSERAGPEEIPGRSRPWLVRAGASLVASFARGVVKD